MKFFNKNQIIKLFNIAVGIFFIALISLHSSGKITLPIIERINYLFYDLRLNSTLENTIDKDIVIIDIDEKSLHAEGKWPWHRDKMGFLTDMLFDYYSVKLVSFDIIFAENDIDPGLKILKDFANNELKGDELFNNAYNRVIPQLSYDDIFSKSLKDRPIVLAYFAYQNKLQENSGQLPKAIMNAQEFPLTERLHKTQSYVANINKIQSSVIHAGYVNNLSVDIDGIYRRLPLLNHFDGNIYESFSLAIVRQLVKDKSLRLEVTNQYSSDIKDQRLEAMHIGPYSIPVDNTATLLVPYIGKQGSFKYYSATDILNATIAPEKLKDKIIIVGTTAAGLYDLRTTPMQNIFPGVEIHANIVSGILNNKVKSRPTFINAIELIEIVVIGILALIIFPRLNAISISIIFVLFLTGIIYLNFYMWSELNIDSYVGTPIVLMTILLIKQLLFSFFFESSRKKQLGNLFGQYIPPELVDEMSKKPETYNMEGDRRNMTVFFSDIRDFTTISEGMDSAELCDLINESLTPITSLIHKHNGTIDKYIGDAVMAFWGAPVKTENHAEASVQAALEIIPALKAIQHDFPQRGWPEIKIGIGINTGIMAVGNMGTEFRVAYTVMGDAVNLGARLEGLSKNYGVDIVVSEYTKAAAEKFIYRELDLVRVKGKQQPIHIFEPLLPNIGTEQKAEVKELNKALKAFRKQNWIEATRYFTQLKSKNSDKKLYSIYLDRIINYQNNPPSTDWDGVYTYTTK